MIGLCLQPTFHNFVDGRSWIGWSMDDADKSAKFGSPAGHRDFWWKKELRNRNKYQHLINSDILIAQIHSPKIRVWYSYTGHMICTWHVCRCFSRRFQVYKDLPICSTQKHPSPERIRPQLHRFIMPIKLRTPRRDSGMPTVLWWEMCLHLVYLGDTRYCWWFRNPIPNQRWDGAKSLVNNGINYLDNGFW